MEAVRLWTWDCQLWCGICGAPIRGAMTTDHLFLPRNRLPGEQQAHRRDLYWNLIVTHPGECHSRAEGAGKRDACMAQYRRLGHGDIRKGYEIVKRHITALELKTHVELPEPTEEDL